MKFAISLDQRDHLRKSGFIPFLKLLKQEELVLLNEGIEHVLDREKKKTTSFSFLGRDLWRQSTEVKRVVFSKRLAELAFDLLQKKPLRLAFDRFLFKEDCKEGPTASELYGDGLSLQAHSSMTNLLGVFFLCLGKRVSFDTWSLEAGDGFFAVSSTAIPEELLKAIQESQFFAIGYVDTFSQYLHEDRDLEVHFLKSLGYVFGDKLNDQLHPILLR